MPNEKPLSAQEIEEMRRGLSRIMAFGTERVVATIDADRATIEARDRTIAADRRALQAVKVLCDTAKACCEECEDFAAEITAKMDAALTLESDAEEEPNAHA